MQIAQYFKNYQFSKTLKEHSFQVEKLSIELFEKLKTIIIHKNIDFKNAKEILSASALLHDIGINLEKFEKNKPHNKIGARLVLENKIENFSDKEIQIIACCIRYHRGSAPNNVKHKLYASLNEDDKQKVWAVSSILRLADALDENHISIIENIELIKTQTGDIEIKTGINHQFNADLTQAFNKKKDMFEEFFKTKIYLG